MGMIEFSHVNKTFPNGYQVIKNLNLDIEKGDFAILVGAPGSGKSTVLRMAAGLEEPTFGEVRIEGELLRNIPPEDRSIAMVFQNYALYPKLTVFDNIGFGLKQRNVEESLIEKKVLEMAEFFEITNLLKKKPKSLSGSERQRVALSRALITDARILILDEPFSSFDKPLRLRIRERFLEAKRQSNRTILYVTHNMEDAMYLATKLIVMKKGKIHQVGTPAQVYAHPRTMFVASFIGEPGINLIDGSCEVWGTKVYITTPMGELSLRGGLESKLITGNYNGKVVVVGLRPDACSIVEEGSPDMEKKHNLIRAKIESVEAFREQLWVRLVAFGIFYNALIPWNNIINPGDEIVFKIDTSKILVYDKETKKILN